MEENVQNINSEVNAGPPKVQIGLSPLGGAALQVSQQNEQGEWETSSAILDLDETGKVALHLLAIYNMVVASAYAHEAAERARVSSLLSKPEMWTPGG